MFGFISRKHHGDNDNPVLIIYTLYPLKIVESLISQPISNSVGG